MERMGLKPTNHARDNIVALRAKQKENREARQAQELQEEVADWKAKKYRDVKSKILINTASPSHPKVPFLRKGSLECRIEDKRKFKASESPRRESPRQMKAAVPRAAAYSAPKRHTDFISENRDKVKEIQISPRGDEKKAGHKHQEFGQVPQYLRDRKAQWSESEVRRLAAQPDPSCPPGMVLMQENERLETLAILDHNEAETRQLLFKLPLHSTTPSILKRKDAFEGKLREIEAAKKVFSKARVYVQG